MASWLAWLAWTLASAGGLVMADAQETVVEIPLTVCQVSKEQSTSSSASSASGKASNLVADTTFDR